MLKAGAAKVKITPDSGTLMAGYTARLLPAEGVHDDLFVRALVISNDELTIGIASADVLLLPGDFTAQICQAIEDTVGILNDQLILAATHTHSGPGGLVDPSFRNGIMAPAMAFFGPYNPNLRQKIQEAFIEAFRLAKQNQEPIQIGIARKEVAGVGANRRIAEKPVDQDVVVLSFRRMSGQTIALLFNQACHPTILGPENLLFSGDLAGITSLMLEGEEGGLIALAMTGADGDISTRSTRKSPSFEEANRLATILFNSIQKARSEMKFISDDQLGMISKSIKLAAAGQLSEAELSSRLILARDTLTTAQMQNASTWKIRQAQTAIEGLEFQLQLATSYPLSNFFDVKFSVVNIGPALIFAFPFELFNKLGKTLRHKTGTDKSFVICYANDFLGYLPTKEDYADGGYEVNMTLLEQGAGEELIKEAYSAIKNIHINPTFS